MLDVAITLIDEAAVELGAVSGFEPVGSEVKWRGAIVTAGVERFRHADGAEVTRDKVWHPGAVGDPRRRRQPRLADPPAA